MYLGWLGASWGFLAWGGNKGNHESYALYVEWGFLAWGGNKGNHESYSLYVEYDWECGERLHNID